MDTDVKSLRRFGEKFQTKSIACLLNDKSFMEQMYDILYPEYYDTEALRWVCQCVLDYWDEYKKPATLDYFKTCLNRSDAGDGLKQSVIRELKYITKAREDTDLDWVKDDFLEFAQNQRIRQAIINSTGLLKRGNYAAIKTEIDDALNAGLSRDIGHMYKEDVEDRLKESARPTITTGFPVLDSLMDGGLAGGEVGVFVAASGAGKSWMLAALGHACMMTGGLVAHYTLELDDQYTGRRYDSIAGGFSPNEVPERQDEIRQRMKEIPGEISIKKWPAKSVTVQSIHAHFERLTTLHERPSLIVLDYADLLKSASSSPDANSYQTMGDIYTDLRRLSGELDVPIWTVSQTNREGTESDVITADMIADSFQKVMISDFVASISRTSDDKVSNTARVHIIKNRFGPDGMTLPSMIDTSCGDIKIFEPGSEEARATARDAKLKAQRKEHTVIADLYDQFKRTGTVSKNETSSF
jgi:replicative DNA helicase